MDSEQSPATSQTSASKLSRPTSSSTHKPPKRIRVTQACDQCRDVKRKCDIAIPSCSPCTAQGQTCTYTRHTKKRGTQPGYMRALETALAWVLEDVPGCQESLQRLLRKEGGGVGGEEERMSALRARWRNSRLFEDMSAVLVEERQGAGGRRLRRPGGVVDVDENTPSTLCESEEEGGGQWPIL